jgi:hypothetical protein
MTPKYWFLIAAALVLGCLSLYLNTDWFRKDRIQIVHRAAPAGGFFRRRQPGQDASAPPLFEFNRKLKLTDIKVVAVSDLATNPSPRLYWHLVSDSNSIPTRGFSYGMKVPGMRPAANGEAPEPLEPGIPYRLLLQAGSLKAEHDFTPSPSTP